VLITTGTETVILAFCNMFFSAGKLRTHPIKKEGRRKYYFAVQFFPVYKGAGFLLHMVFVFNKLQQREVPCIENIMNVRLPNNPSDVHA
jgi:hypothetical protein